jgi:Na+-translocating ferredoxin:NAD+ oxidoreductase RnfD subunit
VGSRKLYWLASENPVPFQVQSLLECSTKWIPRVEGSVLQCVPTTEAETYFTGVQVSNDVCNVVPGCVLTSLFPFVVTLFKTSMMESNTAILISSLLSYFVPPLPTYFILSHGLNHRNFKIFVEN